jgi:ribosomal protein S18 acetylase RimI-like enzyme
MQSRCFQLLSKVHTLEDELTNMEYRFLKEEDFSLLYETYLRAFSDYVVKMQPTVDQLAEMMIRRGIKYEISVGGFDNGRLVGFNLNGIGDWNERLTAYDISTGIIPEYRSKGITYKLFDFSFSKLKELNVTQYLLEVIASNERAFKAYSRIGFKEIRGFDCFILKPDSVNENELDQTTIHYKIEAEPDWELYRSFWDWHPSWQNSISSVKRSKDRKVIISALDSNDCIGYGIIYPSTGDLTQIAVDKRYRRRGIGTNIVLELIKHLDPEKAVRILNIDKSARETIDFLIGIRSEYFISQKEMLLELA